MSRSSRLWGAMWVLAALSAATVCPVRAEDGPGAGPAFPDPAVRAWQVGILRPDRVQHMTLSFTAGAMIGLPSRSAEATLIGTLGLGLAKELWDARTGRFDAVDLIATCLGGAAAAATITVTR